LKFIQILVICIIALLTTTIAKKAHKTHKAHKAHTKVHSCQNDGQQKLINELKKEGTLKSAVVEKVMCGIDRMDFAAIGKEAYSNESSYIKHGATISIPRVHARALEVMYEKFKGKKNLSILDIGSGSGYLTIALAKLFPGSKVIGLEHIKKLTEDSIVNINKHNKAALTSKQINMITGDGKNGMESHRGGFDIIHIGASAPSTPTRIIKQLKVGGRLFTPVQDTPHKQHIHIYDKLPKGKFTDIQDIQEDYVNLQDSKVQTTAGIKNIYLQAGLKANEKIFKSHQKKKIANKK
jgi:protein-L-isoaspartate(D-aspartate) O-methyltransferase